MEDQITPETENTESADNTTEQTQEPSSQVETAEQPQQSYNLPPGYAYEPATGQVFYVGPAMQQPVYTQLQPDAEQIDAAQAASTQRYGQVINSVEQFLEGEATVSDVVKTLYTNTTQDDQLWKGVIVGAAAAVLLTSDPVKKAMGQTLGGVFPGLKQNQPKAGAATTAAKSTTTESPIPDKE